jgi:hypothetical protein
MVGYVALNKADKYNNRTYFNVKDNIKKFNNVRDQVNGVQKNSIK